MLLRIPSLSARQARLALAPCAAAVLALLGAPRGAAAQVSAERFQPAPGPRNFLSVETARTTGDMSYSLGLSTSYAYEPFRLLHCLPGPCDAAGAMVDHLHVLKNLFTANLLASLTPVPASRSGSACRWPTPRGRAWTRTP